MMRRMGNREDEKELTYPNPVASWMTRSAHSSLEAAVVVVLLVLLVTEVVEP